MKKMMTFLPLLFFLNLLGAMNQNVNLSGVLEDHTGAAISNAAINIKVSNGWIAYSNTVYTDSFGNYSDTIVLPDTMNFAELTIKTNACTTIALLTEYRTWEPIPASDYVALNCPSPSSCQVEAVLNNSILLIEASGSGGVPPYSFLWNTGETTSNISPPNSGWYSVTLTDSEGCTTADNIFVYHPNYCDVEIVYTQNDMLNANPVFGNGPISYLWSTGETTNSIVPSVADSYIVTITASDGCMSSDTIFFDPDLVDSCSVSIDVYQDGDMLHAAAIGIEPFLYNWNTGSISSSVWPDSIGDYCVTVTDFTGCTTTACHTVEYLCNLDFWLDINDSLLTIEPIITEGTPPFTYNWNTGETTPSIQLTATGLYNLTITDANDCTYVGGTYFNASYHCGVSLYLTEDTLLQTTNLYGEAPFTYAWSTGETTTSIAPTEAGYYSVTINASNGCVNGDTIYYDPDLLDSCSVSIVAYQGGNVLSASASGEAPFNYSWDTGSSSNYIWPDSNGVYCVTVTDTYSCSSTACYTVTNMCDLNFWLSINDSLYTIEPNNITGGTPPFTYNWSTGETTPSIQPTVTGYYLLTITDAYGCTVTRSRYFDYSDYCGVSVYLTEDTLLQTTNLYGEAPFTYAWNTGETTSSIAPTEAGYYSVTINANDGCTIGDTIYYDPNWIDSCDVTLTLSPNGNYLSASASGVAPFSYNWNTGSTWSTIWPDSNGVYCVTVVDSYGCTATACQNVTSICNMVVDIFYNNDSIALLDTDILIPGTAPYVYNWSTGETTASIIPTTPGVYYLTVTDAYGCSDTDAFYFDLNDYCDVNINVTPDDDLNASAYGADPLTYLWSTGETSSTIDPPSVGVYAVTITASDGCVSADTLFYNPGLIDSCTVLVETHQNGYCLQAYGSGEAPLSYTWNTGATGTYFCPGANGQYCVTMTDSTGCTATACGTISAYLDSCEVVIVDSIAGELMALPSGSVANSYNFLWSTGDTLPSITNVLPNQTYCVTITNSYGCEASDCFTTNFNGPSLSGYVSLENMPSANIDEAIVQLFEYNQGAGGMEMIASTPLVDGNFAFLDIPVGDYLLRAMLGEADPNTETFLPTYNNHELWWNDVTAISVSEAVTNQQILLIAAEPLGSGLGSISGGVEEGENIRGNDDDRNAGEPIADVSIILLNADELPVAYAMTDSDGQYSFENLPWGTYKVVLEIAGIEQPAYWVTLSPEMPSVDDQNFIVDEDSAATTVSTSSIVMGHSISLFPNPTRAEIYLNFELSQTTILNIDLVNVNGQTVLSRRFQLGAGQYTETFDLKTLPAGVYQLQMVDAKGTTSRKIVKY